MIIPAYNEQDSILGVIEKLKKDCPSADYVIVNDCSVDHTLSVLQNNRLNHINLPINLGIGGGVQTGYMYALEKGYDIAIQVDGDGQHDTSYLNTMIQLLDNGETDIVIGSRFVDREGFLSSPFRRLGISFLSSVIKFVTGRRILDVTSGLRAVNRRGIDLYSKEYSTDYPEPEAIVLAALKGYKIAEIPVCMKEREHGQSSINKKGAVYYMIKVTLAIFLCRFTHKKERNIL